MNPMRLFHLHPWLAWLAGLASAAVIGLVGALAVIFSGVFDVSASTPHISAVAWLTHTTMQVSVNTRAKDIRPPGRFTSGQVAEGGREYGEHCAVCHGGPGVARARWVSAMTPTPPYLLDASQRWSPREIYWIVHHGVKMTAMPAWGEVMPDDEIWSLVAFVDALPTLSPAEYRLLTRPPGTGTPEPGDRSAAEP